MREFLKGLDFDKETIDTIMAEYGKQVESLKEQIENYKEKEEKTNNELADYKKQVDSLNKTVEEKNKSLEDLQNVTNENNDLKAQIQMSDANVKKEFLKFVTNEVKEKAGESNDFGKALEDYKKENPQYFGDTVVKKVQTSPGLNNGGNKEITTNDIMNDILRSRS